MKNKIHILDAVAVFLGLLVVLNWVSDPIGMTWDEVTYLRHASSMARWFEMGMPFDAVSINQTIASSPYLNPHPPLLKWIGMLCIYVLKEDLGVLGAFRFGHHFVFSLIASLTFFISRGILQRSYAALLLSMALFQPRIMGQASLATSDGVLVVCFFGGFVATWKLIEDDDSFKPGALLLWMSVVIAMSVKVTGVLLLIPIATVFLYNRKFKELAWLFFAAGSGLCAVVLVDPQYWLHPIHGVVEYLTYPLQRKSIPITSFYLGECYNSGVPWHYAWVMLVSVTPEWALVGLVSALIVLRKAHHALVICLVFLGFWAVIAMAPSTPKHDEIRQFLPIATFIGLISFFVIKEVEQRFLQRCSYFNGCLKFVWPYGLSCIILAAVALSRPYPTMYYNSFVGGMKGASQKGLELALYFEPFDDVVISQMNNSLPHNAKIEINPDWRLLFLVQQSLGKIRDDLWILSSKGNYSPLPLADFSLLLRRRAIIDDEVFFMPGSLLIQRDYQGESVLRLVRIDSGFHKVSREFFRSNSSLHQVEYSRWNKGAIETLVDHL
ncbi:MAG: hypothetical protein H6686_08660 [Fibrobacteria bacterium]|nr:hypothetical protein [Fibrobacteria bacterium]